LEGFQNPELVIGPIVPGLDCFAVTRGQIGLVDLVRYVLGELGPGNVTVWTWAVSDAEATAFEFFLSSPLVTGGRIVLEQGAARRNHAMVARWLDRFGAGSVRAVRTHAKIATIEAGGLQLVARGSMNLDQHEIIEQFDVTESAELFAYVTAIEMQLPAFAPAAPVVSSGGKAASSGDRQLKLFSGIKSWAK
jgi:hypothetical protein